MALVKPDYSETNEPLVPGTYQSVVKNSAVKQWEGGVSYIEWELETVGNPDPKMNGRKITHKTNLSGKGAFTTAQIFHAATGQKSQGEFDTAALHGKRVLVDLVYQVKNGQQTEYTQVNKVRPVMA